MSDQIYSRESVDSVDIDSVVQNIENLKTLLDEVPDDLDGIKQALFLQLRSLSLDLLNELKSKLNEGSINHEEMRLLNQAILDSLNTRGMKSYIPDYIYRTKYNLGSSPEVLKRYIAILIKYMNLKQNDIPDGNYIDYDDEHASNLVEIFTLLASSSIPVNSTQGNNPMDSFEAGKDDIVKLDDTKLLYFYRTFLSLNNELSPVLATFSVFGDFFNNPLSTIVTRLYNQCLKRDLNTDESR